ncbi:hypothetical protein RMCBS344292_07131 [Rhizopus microsporus]|nr:hypothetical protein RMCBS344292_07131 [Rhizopus microsporus]
MLLSMVLSGLLRIQLEITSRIKSRTELEVDHVQTIFEEVYECHRAGSKRRAMAIQRTLQKKSKKVGCKARLIATCNFSNPEEVVITVDGNHCHVLGSAEDLQYLPLSADVKEAILQRLQEGYNTRSVRFAMHRAFRSHNEASTSIPHRDNFIHSEDVYSIFRKVFERAYKRHDDQKTSVKHWLNHLETKNYNVFIDNDYDSSFTFGFCSAWQASLLAETKDFSLDATHNTAAFKDGLLYTLVIRHAETGTGSPVPFLFTTNRSFLAFKSLVLPFKTFCQSLS